MRWIEAKGVADPSFTGFHLFELRLWSAAPVAKLEATLTALASQVAALRSNMAEVIITPLDYATRAHEILENALQEQVTGLTEPYSHTGIADTAASMTGAIEVVSTLMPVLRREQASIVAPLRSDFAALQADLATLRRPGGSFVPDNALTIAQREHLTASLDGLLSVLDRVPGLLEIPQEPRDLSDRD